MERRVLINTATSYQPKYLIHLANKTKNTLWKILNDLKKLSPWHQLIFKFIPIQTEWDPKKKASLKVYSLNIFSVWQLSQKHNVHNLKQFKESFIDTSL